MRKRITMILASLFMIMGTAWAEEAQTVDYTPTNTGERTGKNAGRKITSVNISTGQAGVNNTYTLTAKEKTSVYVDKTTEHTMTVIAGETVTATIEREGAWTHAYVYIDLDSDGFTASGATSSTDCTPKEDLMSYSFYSGDEDNDVTGYNPEGTVMTTSARNTMTMPSFTAPTTPGTYRMRFKMDWNSIDPAGGTTFVTNGGGIVDVTLQVVGLDVTKLIENAEALANAVTAGSVVGTYTEESVNNLTTAIETFKAIEGTPTDEQIAALQSAMKGLVLNMPTPGKFYRLMSNNNSQYLGNTKSTTVQTSEATDATTIYYLEAGEVADQYYLVSYGNGYYFANPWQIGVGTAQITGHNEIFKQYVIIEEGNTGYYAFRYGNGSVNYLTANGTATNYTTDKTKAEAQWTIKEVDALPVTIGTVGYATLYTPVALTIHADVTAYAGTLSGDALTLKAIDDGTIPAGTGVVLKAKETLQEATTFEFTIAADVDAVESALIGHAFTNALTSVTEATPYTLQSDGNGGVVFKQYTGDNLTGFKAYLPIPDGTEPAATALRIRFAGEEDGGTTGIDLSAPEAQPVVIYDLHGRRVTNATKGVYIVNGKKVVIK